MANIHSERALAGYETGEFPEESSGLLPRTKIAQMMESDLKGFRVRAEMLNDPLLLYLIDITLLQLQRKRIQTTH